MEFSHVLHVMEIEACQHRKVSLRESDFSQRNRHDESSLFFPPGINPIAIDISLQRGE
jgi:hypothetical protein